jgi:hypothetical protein
MISGTFFQVFAQWKRELGKLESIQTVMVSTEINISSNRRELGLEYEFIDLN